MKGKRGITLIALIITIIVMLILVAVTVSVALNGGIFNKASKARKDTEIEADREELLSAVVGTMNHQEGTVQLDNLVTELGTGWTHNGSNFPVIFTKTKTGNRFLVAEDGLITLVGRATSIGGDTGGKSPATYEKAENLTLGTNVSLVAYENLTGDIKEAVDNGRVKAVLTETISGTPTIAVIPTGFTVSTTTGENTISGGLVVTDGLSNEFVWIPVPEISQMAVPVEQGSSNYSGVLYDWETDTTGNTEFTPEQNYSDCKEPDNITVQLLLENDELVEYDSQDAFTEYGGGTYSDTMYQTEFNSMVESVAKYKGFYVGRYETGGFNGSTIVVKAGETGTTNSSSANNSINCANWYKMYKMQKDFASNNENVASTMIWGCQWDQVMKFVNEKNDGASNKFYVAAGNSARKTQGIIRETGSNINDKVQNIYDLEGSVMEWTLEEAYDAVRVLRGGYSYDEGASRRDTDYAPDRGQVECAAAVQHFT